MLTPTSNISDYQEGDLARRIHADGEGLRYRLDVVGVNAADIVQAAGGWLYNRVMAGWEVTALLPPGCDIRPLQILGIQAASLGAECAAATQTLAVSAQAHVDNDCVQERVRQALEHRLTEVVLWGEGWPLGVNRGLTQVRITLGAAARAFKQQALTAAEITCRSAHFTETLLTDTPKLG